MSTYQERVLKRLPEVKGGSMILARAIRDWIEVEREVDVKERRRRILNVVSRL